MALKKMPKKSRSDADMASLSIDELPPEALETAAEADALEDEAVLTAAPEGEFTPDAVNGLIKKLNQVLPMFGADTIPLVEPGDEVMSELPPDVLRSVQMVLTAFRDAELGSVPVSMADLVDDQGLERMGTVLKGIARSAEFKRFLRSNAGQQPIPEPEAESPRDEAVSVPEDEAVDDDELDELLGSRL